MPRRIGGGQSHGIRVGGFLFAGLGVPFIEQDERILAFQISHDVKILQMIGFPLFSVALLRPFFRRKLLLFQRVMAGSIRVRSGGGHPHVTIEPRVRL
jgi:hypothetical protein